MDAERDDFQAIRGNSGDRSVCRPRSFETRGNRHDRPETRSGCTTRLAQLIEGDRVSTGRRNMDFKGDEPHDEPVAVAQVVRSSDAFIVHERAVLTPEVPNLYGSGIIVDDDTTVMAADESAGEPDMTVRAAPDQKFGLNQRVIGRFQNEGALIGSINRLKNDFHVAISCRKAEEECKVVDLNDRYVGSNTVSG
jgi:hypothetical protein